MTVCGNQGYNTDRDAVALLFLYDPISVLIAWPGALYCPEHDFIFFEHRGGATGNSLFFIKEAL